MSENSRSCGGVAMFARQYLSQRVIHICTSAASRHSIGHSLRTRLMSVLVPTGGRRCIIGCDLSLNYWQMLVLVGMQQSEMSESTTVQPFASRSHLASNIRKPLPSQDKVDKLKALI